MRLVNYHEHEADNRYMVFIFHENEHADYFALLLKDGSVDFERFFDDESDPPQTLFGVKKSYLDYALKMNYLVHAKYRRPFIKSTFLKWTLLIVTGSFLALAVIGYIKSH